jgi:hypothetical protein
LAFQGYGVSIEMKNRSKPTKKSIRIIGRNDNEIKFNRTTKDKLSMNKKYTIHIPAKY